MTVKVFAGNELVGEFTNIDISFRFTKVEYNLPKGIEYQIAFKLTDGYLNKKESPSTTVKDYLSRSTNYTIQVPLHNKTLTIQRCHFDVYSSDNIVEGIGEVIE